MIMSLPILASPIEFSENKIPVLVIEDHKLYRKTIEEIVNQCQGLEGECVVSENFEPISIQKYVSILTDFFNLDFSDRQITSKLQKAAVSYADSFSAEIINISETLSMFAENISSNFDYPITYKQICDAPAIIKILDFQVDTEDMSIPEKLIEYIRINRDFLNKRLFIICGLKSLFSKDEIILLYKSFIYEKINVLLLESHQGINLYDYEDIIIIDEDYCII